MLKEVAGVAWVAELASHGQRRALSDGRRALTYAELAAQIDQTAAQLGERRLTLIELRPTIDLVVHYLAALAAGHPVIVSAPDASSAPVLHRFDPDFWVGGLPHDGVRRVERRAVTAHEWHPELALLLSTSGSTGSPKLARLSARSVDANARGIAAALGLTSDDVAITSLPLHYCYGLSVLHSHLAVGANVVLTDQGVADPSFWELAVGQRVTTLSLVPSQFDLLEKVADPLARLGSLRRITQAGGRLAPARVRQWAARGTAAGWDLLVMYGQTEATARMTVLPAADALTRPHSVGLPLRGSTMAVTSPDAHGVGALRFTGPGVMMGYAEAPADLALPAGPDSLITGDLGRIDADGYVEIVGRVARFAKIHGLRIDLDQVEEQVSARVGRVMVAEGDRGLAALTIAAQRVPQVRRAIAGASGIPECAITVAAVDRWPLLPSGKPDYPAVVSSARQAAVAPARLDPEQALCAAYSTVMGRAATNADSFVSLGGDSLLLVEASVRVEQIVGGLPRDWHRRTIAELAKLAEPAGRGEPTPEDPTPRSNRLEASTRRDQCPQTPAYPSPPRARTSRGWVSVDPTVLLRAVAIVLIVGSHSDVFTLMGAAHVLIALLGYNCARFALAHPEARDRSQAAWTCARRIAVPSMLWIAGVLLVTGTYDWSSVLLVHGLVGSPHWGPGWQLWFVEAAVQLLLAAGLLARIPALTRLDRQHPFALPWALTVVLVALRHLVTLPSPGERFTLLGVAWLFGLGWALARAATTTQRLAALALLPIGLVGLFDDALRSGVVVLGVLAVAWLRPVRLPRFVLGPVSAVAASSLAVYLVHWQVYPAWEDKFPLAGLLLSLGAGLVAWRLYEAIQSGSLTLLRKVVHESPGAFRRTLPCSAGGFSRLWRRQRGGGSGDLLRPFGVAGRRDHCGVREVVG